MMSIKTIWLNEIQNFAIFEIFGEIKETMQCFCCSKRRNITFIYDTYTYIRFQPAAAAPVGVG